MFPGHGDARVRVALFGRGFDVLHACNPPDTFWLLGRFWKLFGRRFIFDHHDLSPGNVTRAKFGRSRGALYRGLLWLERRDCGRGERGDHHQPEPQGDRGRAGREAGGRRLRGARPARTWRGSPVSARPGVQAAASGTCSSTSARSASRTAWTHMVRAVQSCCGSDSAAKTSGCLFVGGGPHQPAIKAYAEELGIMDVRRVHRPGERRRALPHPVVGHARDRPGPEEPWSDKSTMNKVMEYMYFGLPVVAYDLHETRVSAGRPGCTPSRTPSSSSRARLGRCSTTRRPGLAWVRSAAARAGFARMAAFRAAAARCVQAARTPGATHVLKPARPPESVTE